MNPSQLEAGGSRMAELIAHIASNPRLFPALQPREKRKKVPMREERVRQLIEQRLWALGMPNDSVAKQATAYALWLRKQAHFVCAYCCRPTDDRAIDHVTALARGGKHAPENLAPACRECNSSKQVQTWTPKVAPHLSVQMWRRLTGTKAIVCSQPVSQPGWSFEKWCEEDAEPVKNWL